MEAASATVSADLVEPEELLEELSLPAPALLGTLVLMELADSAEAMEKSENSLKKEVSLSLVKSVEVVVSKTLTSQARPRAVLHSALVVASGEENSLPW